MTVANRGRFNLVLGVFLALMVVGLLGSTYYLYSELQLAKSGGASQKAKADEVKKTIDALAKVMELPKEEEPIIASVVDKNKLKGQPFFDKAANGDKVIIYANSKMAILYRPNTGKIVKVAPLVINANASEQAAGAVAGASDKKVRSAVILVMSTKPDSEKSQAITKKLQALYKNAKVMPTTAKQEIKQEAIVNITGDAKLAASIAENLDIAIGKLPGGEAVEADIAILLTQ